MDIQVYGFIIDVLVSGLAMWGALAYLRVWWAYIIAGEMITSLGLSILFGVFGVGKLGWDDTNWFFLYGITQGVAMLLLLFSLTRAYFLSTYAVAGLSALMLGMLAHYDHDYVGLGYVSMVVLFGGVKVGLMVYYWRSVCVVWRDSSFNRIHVWQD